jgi:hypothetical protein
LTPEHTPPFGDWVTKFLLAGPSAGPVPRDLATREELRDAWGKSGERCGATWTQHEAWLRATAAERNIQPTFRGQFFIEALAKGWTR